MSQARNDYDQKYWALVLCGSLDFQSEFDGCKQLHIKIKFFCSFLIAFFSHCSHMADFSRAHFLNYQTIQLCRNFRTSLGRKMLISQHKEYLHLQNFNEYSSILNFCRKSCFLGSRQSGRQTRPIQDRCYTKSKYLLWYIGVYIELF